MAQMWLISSYGYLPPDEIAQGSDDSAEILIGLFRVEHLMALDVICFAPGFTSLEAQQHIWDSHVNKTARDVDGYYEANDDRFVELSLEVALKDCVPPHPDLVRRPIEARRTRGRGLGRRGREIHRRPAKPRPRRG